MDEETRKEMEALSVRVKFLEESLGEIFSVKKKSIRKDNMKGLSRGIYDMIQEGFFDEPKFVNEAMAELENKGHFGSKQRVDTTIRRDFFKRKGLLTRRKEGKNWKYSKIK